MVGPRLVRFGTRHPLSGYAQPHKPPCFGAALEHHGRNGESCDPGRTRDFVRGCYGEPAHLSARLPDRQPTAAFLHGAGKGHAGRHARGATRICSFRRCGLKVQLRDPSQALPGFAKIWPRLLQLGYALDDEEAVTGARCIGAAILDANGKVAGGISISGPTSRINKTNLAFDCADRQTGRARNLHPPWPPQEKLTLGISQLSRASFAIVLSALRKSSLALHSFQILK